MRSNKIRKVQCIVEIKFNLPLISFYKCVINPNRRDIKSCGMSQLGWNDQVLWFLQKLGKISCPILNPFNFREKVEARKEKTINPPNFEGKCHTKSAGENPQKYK